ncbi:MAG TPA: NADPH:quinone reductase [Polyangiaceae bacterium]|jgi:NADPH2:quinone reductase|nr:NADPH:quinone reductase [Polyangiaceae bacterium]
MKAIRVHAFGAPDVMKIEDVPDPKPGPEQVVVRVKAAGVNPSDTYMRSGAYTVKPPLPYTPGSDGAGIVEAIGEGVTHVAVGDRVYLARSASGTYAELALAQTSQVYALPERVSFARGAALNVPYVTAYRALRQIAHARGGETVLVHGASGGVGIAAVQFARAMGLRVIGTAGTDAGRELVRKEGAHVVLDHHDPKYREGLVCDVILEMLANVNLGHDSKMLAPRGRVVVIGSRGDVTITPRDLMTRDASVHAMLLWNISPDDERDAHAAIAAGLENGTLRPVVRMEMPLADAPRAHEAVLAPGAFGKIVLVP